MGRSRNETCWACSLLTAAEARKLHDATAGGDGCWQDAAGMPEQVNLAELLAQVDAAIAKLPEPVRKPRTQRVKPTDAEVG